MTVYAHISNSKHDAIWVVTLLIFLTKFDEFQRLWNGQVNTGEKDGTNSNFLESLRDLV